MYSDAQGRDTFGNVLVSFLRRLIVGIDRRPLGCGAFSPSCFCSYPMCRGHCVRGRAVCSVSLGYWFQSSGVGVGWLTDREWDTGRFPSRGHRL